MSITGSPASYWGDRPMSADGSRLPQAGGRQSISLRTRLRDVKRCLRRFTREGRIPLSILLSNYLLRIFQCYCGAICFAEWCYSVQEDAKPQVNEINDLATAVFCCQPISKTPNPLTRIEVLFGTCPQSKLGYAQIVHCG